MVMLMGKTNHDAAEVGEQVRRQGERLQRVEQGLSDLKRITENLIRRMEKPKGGRAAAGSTMPTFIDSTQTQGQLTTFVVGLWGGTVVVTEILDFVKLHTGGIQGYRDTYAKGKRPKVAYIKVDRFL